MQIDFFVIDSNSKMQALQRLCLLLEQPYTDQQTIYINAATKEDAELIDNLLWIYREDSFLAHELIENASNSTPIAIGVNPEPGNTRDILVNLQTDIPEHINTFSRIIEVVFKDPAIEELARERYRKYREQGHELTTHKLKAN